jgi:hypothetical protein
MCHVTTAFTKQSLGFSSVITIEYYIVTSFSLLLNKLHLSARLLGKMTGVETWAFQYNRGTKRQSLHWERPESLPANRTSNVKTTLIRLFSYTKETAAGQATEALPLPR